MPHNSRLLVALLALVSLLHACKATERLAKRSDSKDDDHAATPAPEPGPQPGPAPSGDAVALKDAPYLVRVGIVLEGEAPVITFNEVKGTFANHCVSCHGAGQTLDLTVFPFKGRYPTPEATVQEILKRVESATAPMPPVPAAPLAAIQIQGIKSWLAGGLPVKQPPRETPVFAQGLVLRVRHKATKAKDWIESSLPWNGSGEFPGFFRQLSPEDTVDVIVHALGEDGKELASQSYQALSVPKTGNLEFSLSVLEAHIKQHAADKSPAAPGAGGVVTARDVEETSFTIQWEPATDVLTEQERLLYAVYVSDQVAFDSADTVLKYGTKVTDFSAYQPALTLTGLTQAKTYYVAVLVKDRGGNVALYKVLVQATAADRKPPTIPTKKITVTDLSDVTATLTWKAATDDLSAPEKLSYQAFFSFTDAIGDTQTIAANAWAASEPALNQLTVKLNGLVPETTYFFNVVVNDEAGNRAVYSRVQVKSRAGSGSIGINSYGRQCAERLGELKPFSCFDGKIIPIVIDGVEIPAGLTQQQAQAYRYGTGANQMKCDKPALLGLGDQGRCVPYSRVGKLKTYRKDGSEHPDVDTVFTCRRYVTRLGPQTYQGKTVDGADHPLFEDIAVLQHNRVTGETCWYQMLRPGYASDDGRRIPPPTEATLPQGTPAYAKTATQFWISPQATADKRCYRCHDADPWMHSPYIDQVRNDDGSPFVPAGGVGSERSGRYSMIGSRAFYKWEKSHAIASTVTTDTQGKSCTTCHDVGSFNGCQTWSKMSAGTTLAPNLTDTGKAFAHRYWMPPPDGSIHTLAEWQSSGFKRAAERLAACCSNPAQDGCSKTPIMTPPPPFQVP